MTTTGTTSPSTTVTSSQTTTQTSTALIGNLECVVDGAISYVTIASAADCGAYIARVNALLETCSGQPGALSCDTINGVDLLRVGDASSCVEASSLNGVLDQYTVGVFSSTFNCTLGGRLKVEQGCDATLSLLNAALIDYVSGGAFEACDRTTPTTTASSTPTTTVTTTTTTTTTQTTTHDLCNQHRDLLCHDFADLHPNYLDYHHQELWEPELQS